PEAGAAAVPEIAMFAPAAGAGAEAAKSSTGSRMLPSTRPTRPPASAVRKHQTATPARTRACNRLNIPHGRPHATRQRVGPAGARRGDGRIEGPAHRTRDGDRSRHLAGP